MSTFSWRHISTGCEITAVLLPGISQLLTSDHCWKPFLFSPYKPYLASGALDCSWEPALLRWNYSMHLMLNSNCVDMSEKFAIVPIELNFHLSKPIHLFPMLNLIGFLSYFIFMGLLLFKTVVCIYLYWLPLHLIGSSIQFAYIILDASNCQVIWDLNQYKKFSH